MDRCKWNESNYIGQGFKDCVFMMTFCVGFGMEVRNQKKISNHYSERSEINSITALS